jgi:Leucine-rich repeat (LRR) protein
MYLFMMLFFSVLLGVFFNLVSSYCNGSISIESHAALAALFNSTAGMDWMWDPPLPSPTVWNFPSPLSAPCSESWQGLACSSNLNSDRCDVTEILLPGYGLMGPIPSELGNIVSLNILELQNNSLTGTIPSELGNLASLRQLYLFLNIVWGPIPTELGSLAELEELYLYESYLSGTIPSELGNLAELEILYLFFNSLNGTIPTELGSLEQLSGLELYSNNLVGVIPCELGRLVNLEDLALFDNSLSGTIPRQLGSLTELTVLALYSNSLRGQIPSELGNLAILGSLSLYSNMLAGSIPSELGNLLEIGALYLNSNSLTGTVPAELGELTNLEALYLFSNSLTGMIPSTLGQLSLRLKGLSLYSNSLTGIIPSELGQLLRLEELYLNSNMLVGSVPAELTELVNLKYLDLSDNLLDGIFPLTAYRWLRLQSINVSSNKLAGSIDVFAQDNYSSLQTVDLSSNTFSGSLSDSVFLHPSLQTIILSQNCFSGSLPSSMCFNSKLENIILDLLTANCGSSNLLLQGFVLRRYMTGTIPACIWNNTSVRVLHLLGNGLMGCLADLSDASMLSVLALGSNQLTGTVPSTFQSHNFTQIDLSINRLSGTLGPELFVSHTATVYDLSVNRLSGGLPSALNFPFNTGVVNIVEGNLFDCDTHDVQPSQEESYQCGSFDFEDSFTAWCVGFGTVSVGWSVFLYRRSDLASHMKIIFGTFSWRPPFSKAVGPVSILAVSLCGLLSYISAKQMLASVSTHTYQYWWSSTIIFTHDWVITLVLFFLLGTSCVLFTSSMMSLRKQTDSSDESGGKSEWILHVRPACKCLAAQVVNVVVVMAANTIYVLMAVDSFTNGVLLAVQAALGIFKIMWSTWAIPWLLSRATDSSRELSNWVFMVLFVFLGAPFASTFCESSSCFLYVLSEPSPISFSFTIPDIVVGSDCNQAGCVFGSVVVAQQALERTVLAPWMYSYQCSSALVTSYVPVLILSYLLSGIVIPAALCFITSGSPDPLLYSKDILPFMVVATDSRSLLRLARKLTVKYILNLAVMLTFGLAAPLLSIAVLCDTMVNFLWMLLLLERLGTDATGLKQKYWNSFGLYSEEVVGCVYIVLGYVSAFWSLFAFDWIADVHGSMAGGLTMLVPLLLPTLIGYIMLRLQRTNMMGGQDSVGLELAKNSNPMIMPQTTNDDFNSDKL